MLNRVTFVGVVAVLLAGGLSVRAADQSSAELDSQFGGKVQPFLQTYCASCHSGAKPKGQIDLTAYSSVTAVVKDHQQWETVLDRLKSKEMPPPEAKVHPSDQQRQEVIDWINALTKFESQKNAGDPGLVLARRMSNAENDYTIRDLTGVDMKPTKEFPVDPANEAGFDNSGESLSMSPALVKKYLDAALLVSEHIVLRPHGFDFAPFPVVAETDRDKFAVRRIIDFYEHENLDYADFFQAAWRFQNRVALGRPELTVALAAGERKISAKYLSKVLTFLTDPAEQIGPIAEIQMKFKALPAPIDGKASPSLRLDCEAMRDFVVELRDKVKAEFRNLPVRGIAAGSQALVLWKDQQYADHRMTYPGGALDLYDAAPDEIIDAPMLIPNDEASQKIYEDSFRRFCEIFPDAFYVSERSRVFLENPRERAADKGNTGRYLSAGFHSQMGYFRDDQPLYELVLDDSQQHELDMLWQELDFITLAPMRQLKQFIWFERAEPPSYMYSPEFNNFRSEDEDITSEAKLQALADAYLAKAQGMNIGQTGLGVIRAYFDRINASIRWVEKARLEAEPSHLDTVLKFAQGAYRRPLSKSEQESIRAFYHTLRDKDGLDHEEAVRDTVASVLMSPYFIYLIDPTNPSPGTRPLTDYELASRLSYFLWSSMPDQTLLAHAAAGDLHKPEVLQAEMKRMLQDPRVRGLATEFAGNWLDVRRFEEHNAVDRQRFPEFTNDLRSAMFEEPIHFFMNVVQQNQSVLDMLYGDYTFVNPVLAKHYGMTIDADSADQWVRVDHAGEYHRGGLLPMAVFLTKNAPGLRTSPVKRGYWVVKRLLGEEIPAPPPNVPVLPNDETKLGDLTLRQTLEKHRADPTCAACHARFDSFGLVFEGYGPVGEWRTRDLADRPVETTATFPKGEEGEGLDGLRTYIRGHRQDDFIDNLCRKLLVYSLGRGLLLSDEPLIHEMREKLVANDYRFGGLIQSIVTSPQFLTRRGSGLVAKE